MNDSNREKKPNTKVITKSAFSIGDVVRHKFLDFRGVIFDVDPHFNNTDEWYLSIPPQFRPAKNQPFYHLMAENEESFYTAYVSQQNLVRDEVGGPIGHPDVKRLFQPYEGGSYKLQSRVTN